VAVEVEIREIPEISEKQSQGDQGDLGESTNREIRRSGRTLFLFP
jgi:hypothetical protein